MADEKRTRAPRRSQASNDLRIRHRKLMDMRLYAVLGFGGILAIFAIVGLLFFFRPSTSQVEKRELAKFPQITAESFLDGSFFSDLGLWYSDTYPLREPLVAAGLAFKNLYGFQPSTQMVGGNVVADTLPVPGAGTDEGAAQPASEAEPAAEAAPDSGNLTIIDEVRKAAGKSAVVPGVNDGPVDVPEASAMQEDIQASIMAGLYVKDGAAYSVYYFVQSAVETYCKALNTCADNLEGEATVYSILVPNNSGAMLPEDELAGLGGTDPREAIRYFNSLYDENVHPVFIYDTLREHNDEYLYFRTDHHWTQLGAYYAYVEFCKVKGTEPADVLHWEHMRFEPFLGSFYDTLGLWEMEANPDYVDAYIPSSTNDLTFWDEDGNQVDWHVITDVSDWATSSKYAAFIGGDKPLTIIENPKMDEDGPSCLVIKESYGCAFVPCLVDDYKTIYVFDCRYSDYNIPQFVREHGIDDVIFINNMTLATTDTVGERLLWMSSE